MMRATVRREKNSVLRTAVAILVAALLLALSLSVCGGAVGACAEAEDVELVTTREGLLRALKNARDGDVITVGDVDFTLAGTGAVHESERLIIDKNVTIRSGLPTNRAGGVATFKNGGFLLEGTKVAGVSNAIRFENICFNGALTHATNVAVTDWDLTYDEGTGHPVSDYTVKAQYAVMCKGNLEVAFEGCHFRGYMHEQGGAVRLFYGDYAGNAHAQTLYGDNVSCRAELTFARCTFADNAALYGGGAVCAEGYKRNVALHFGGCSFEDNLSGAGDYALGGGAVALTAAKADFDGCRFGGNVANYVYAGAPVSEDPDASMGGAVCAYIGSELNMLDCAFVGNGASLGGAVAIAASTAVVDGCIFDGNRAQSRKNYETKSLASCGGLGGAVWCNNPESVRVINTDVRRNTAQNAYAAVYTDYGKTMDLGARGLEMAFCTVADNVAEASPADFYKYGEANCEYKLYPSDFWAIPYVKAVGCVVIDAVEGARQTPAENNGYNYRATPAQADEDGYTRRYDEQADDAHLAFAGLAVVPNAYVAAQFPERAASLSGDFTVGANAAPTTYELYVGTELADTITVAYGHTVELPVYLKVGYTFVEWRTADGKAYADGVTYYGNGANPVRLYAAMTYNEPQVPQPAGGRGAKPMPEYTIVIIVLCGVLALGAATMLLLLGGYAIRRKKEGDVPQETAPTEAAPAEKTPVTEEDVARILAANEDVAALSEREKEVLKGVLAGKKRKEIAAELFISESTVKKHIASIYAKLGASSRAELLAKLFVTK